MIRIAAVVLPALLLWSCTTMPPYDIRSLEGIRYPSGRLSEMTVDVAGRTLSATRAGVLENTGERMFVVAKEGLVEDAYFSVPLTPGRYEIYEWSQGGSARVCLVTRTQEVDLAWRNPRTDWVSRETGVCYLPCDHRRFLIFPEAVETAIRAELKDNSRFEDAYYSGHFTTVEVRGKGRGAYLTTPGLGAPGVFVGHDRAGEPVALLLYDP